MPKKDAATEAKIKSLFASLDKDGSGEVDADELKGFFGTANQADLDALFSRIDLNGDLAVTIHELSNFFTERKQPAPPPEPEPAPEPAPAPAPAPAPVEKPQLTEELLTRIDALFAKVDVDGSGAVDLTELRTFFGEEATAMLEELDNIEKDGMVSSEEWRHFFELYLGVGQTAKALKKGLKAAEKAVQSLEGVVMMAQALKDTASPEILEAEVAAEAEAAAAKAKSGGKPAKPKSIDDIATIEKRIDDAFACLDVDGSGEIEMSELREVFQTEAGKMMGELDIVERDGKVSVVEWRQFFEQYRQLDGGKAHAATSRAIEVIEQQLATRAELKQIDEEIFRMEARKERENETAAKSPKVTSRSKIDSAKELDAELNG